MKLKGLSASMGCGVGSAKIILNVADVAKVLPGDVMVVRHSNPAYAVGLFNAAAVISENGGSLFHLAILAREVGVPLVSGVENACDIIKEGNFVNVNASAEEGVVILDES